MQLLGNRFFENRWRVLIFLLAPCALLYFKSIYFDFTTLDEQWMIIQNADFMEHKESLTMAFTKPLAGVYFRPLLLVSIVADYRIDKLNTHVFHFTNLLWHLLAVWLLFRFFITYSVEKRVAFLFALIFSVHPVNLHAVVWVPGRNDLILAVFVLSSLIFLKKYIDGQKLIYLLLHALSFAACLLTKENAIVLPLIYAAILFIYKRKDFWAVSSAVTSWLIILPAWFFLRQNIIEYAAPLSYSFGANSVNTLIALSVFIGKMILPLKLSVFPTLKNATLWPGIVSTLALVVLFFKPGIRDKRIAFLGLLICFSILFIPAWYSAASSIREHYEHRAYIPLMGLLLFLSQVKFNYASKNFAYVAIVVILLLGTKSFVRMGVYENKSTFLSCASKECPDHFLFQLQMGEKLFSEGHAEAALPYFNKALELRPDKREIYNNRGTAYYSLGRYTEAINDFTKALEGPDKQPSYYINRCSAYIASGQTNNAMKDLVVLKQCCANLIPANLEQEVTMRWQVEEVGKVTAQINSEPKNGDLYFKRSQIYFGVGQNQQGIDDLKKACELSPDNESYLKLYLKKMSEMK